MFSIVPLLLLLLASFKFAFSLQPAWQSLTDIPTQPRQEHTAVFLPPDNIIIIGGITNGTASTTDIVQSYSIRARKWDMLPPLPLALNHPNAAVVGGKIYVLGGLAQRPEAWSAIPDSWVFDPKHRVWESIAPLPEPRGSAAIGVFRGKIILAGGLEQIQLVSPFAQDTVDIVSIYDTTQHKWVSIQEASRTIPDTRDHACAAVIDSHIYVLGGRERGQLKGKDTVLSLDLRDLDAGWNISSAKLPTPRAGLACGAIGSKIYTFGGEGNLKVDSGIFNETEAYDVKSNTWEALGEMEFPRHGTVAVSVGGRIYVPGGGDNIGMAPVSYFDYFAPL